MARSPRNGPRITNVARRARYLHSGSVDRRLAHSVSAPEPTKLYRPGMLTSGGTSALCLARVNRGLVTFSFERPLIRHVAILLTPH